MLESDSYLDVKLIDLQTSISNNDLSQGPIFEKSLFKYTTSKDLASLYPKNFLPFRDYKLY